VGRPADPVIGNVEGPESQGNLKVRIIDGTRGAKSRGNSELHRWGCQRKEVRGDSKTRHWHNRRVRGPGRLGRPPAGAGRSARRGNPKNGSKAIPRDRSSGRPEDRSIGTAEGCEIRGDLRLHRRQSRRCRTKGNRNPGSKALQGEVRKTGRPGESQKPATRNDVKFGATRKSIAGTAKGLRKRGDS